MLTHLCLLLCSLANVLYGLCCKAEINGLDEASQPHHSEQREEATFKGMASIEMLFDYCFWEGGAHFKCRFFLWLQSHVLHGKQAAQ